MARLLRSTPPQPKFLGPDLPPPVAPFAPINVNLATGLLTNQRRAQQRFPWQGWDGGGAIDALSGPASSEVLGAVTTDYSFGNASGAGGASQFVAGSFTRLSGPLTGVTVLLDKVGAPSDNVVVEIQSNSGASPSGIVLATSSTVVAGSDLSTLVRRFAYFAISGVTLNAATTYWVVLRRDGALSDTDYYAASVCAGTPAAKTSKTGVWVTQTGTLIRRVDFVAADGSRSFYGFKRNLGPFPPLVLNPLPSQQQQTVAVTPASGLLTNQRRAQQRRTTTSDLRPPTVVTAAAAFIAQPVAVNCLQPDRLAHRYRRMPSQVSLTPPTTLQTFGGPAVTDVALRARYERQRRRLPDSFLLPPATLEPESVSLAERTIRTTLVDIRPRPTSRDLSPPATLEPQSVFLAERVARVRLARTRPRRTASALPVVISTSRAPVVTTLAVNLASGLLTNQRRNQQRVSAYKLGSPAVVAVPAAVETTVTVVTVKTRPRPAHALLGAPILATVTFVAPPLNVNCVSPDRLSHRFRRQPPTAALQPPTALQTFSGPAVYELPLDRFNRRHRRPPQSQLFGPATLEPESVFLAERAVRVRLARTRPRHTIWLLAPPTVVRVPSVEQAEQTIRIDLVRTRPRPKAAALGKPTTLATFAGPNVNLLPTDRFNRKHRRAVNSTLAGPTVLQTFAGPAAPRVRVRPRRTVWSLPVVIGASTTPTDTSILVALVRTRPRSKAARLTPPTALRVFAGPTVALTHARPRPTAATLAAPATLEPYAVTLAERTVRVTAVRTRPRPTGRRLTAPTVLRTFTGPGVTLTRVRPRHVVAALGEATVVRVPSVEQAEDTIRVTLVTLRAAQRRRPVYALTAVSYPATSDIQVTLTRVRPRPTATLLTAVTYPATSDIQVALVRARPRPTVRTLYAPTVLRTFAAGTPTLARTRPRATRHLLGPPTRVRVPQVEQQEDTIRVALVQTRPRPTRHYLVPPLVKTFPPVVTTLVVKTVAVRRRTEQGRHVVGHFLRGPQAVIPLPTLRVQTIDVHRVRARPRHTVALLGKPAVLATFEQGAATLARTRPRATVYALRPPTALRTFTAGTPALARTRPRATVAFLNPPAAVRVPSVEQREQTVQTALVRARPRPTRHTLTAVSYPQAGRVAVTLARLRPRPTTAALAAPAVVARQQFQAARPTLARTRPRATMHRLAAPAVLATFAAGAPTLARTRPRPVTALLSPPARVAAVAPPVSVALARTRPRHTMAVLAPPATVAQRPPVVTALTVKLAAGADRLRRRLHRPRLPVVIGPVRVSGTGVTEGYDIAATAALSDDVASGGAEGASMPEAAAEAQDSPSAATDGYDSPATATDGETSPL